MKGMVAILGQRECSLGTELLDKRSKQPQLRQGIAQGVQF